MKQILTGIFLAACALTLAAYVVWMLTGCSFDPVSGPDRKHPVRTNAFRVSNAIHGELDPATFSISDAEPPPRRLSPAGWEFMPVPNPTEEVQCLLLQSTPPKIKWQAEPGLYRVLVSDDGTNYFEDSFTVVFRRTNWTEWPIYLPKPTNRAFRVVRP